MVRATAVTVVAAIRLRQAVALLPGHLTVLAAPVVAHQLKQVSLQVQLRV